MAVRLQAQNPHQPGEIFRVFRVDRDVERFGELAQEVRLELVERLVERLEFGKQPAVLFLVILLEPDIAQQLDLQQTPYRLRGQAGWEGRRGFSPRGGRHGW